MLSRRIFWFVLLVLTAGSAFPQGHNEPRPETEIGKGHRPAARQVIAGREVPSAAPLNPR